jgi:hypothetical protein
MRTPRVLTALFVAGASLVAPAGAHALSLENLGTFDQPTYVTSDPSDANRLFVVERPGKIILDEGGETTTFLDIQSLVLSPPEPGTENTEGGLFSVAFAPNSGNRRFYVIYRGADDPATAAVDETGDWHLDEFRASGNTADPSTRRPVLTVDYPSADISAQLHYGGQLVFGPDRLLWASLGDGGPQGDPNGNAQDTTDLFGSILRIQPRGSQPGAYTVPPDNPFAGTPGCSDGCDEIWSYGLRNPWRFSFDRLTNELTIGDVGRDGWEELDYAPSSLGFGRGLNFGWGCREGRHPAPGTLPPGCANPATPFTEPILEYAHVNGFCWSITGGYVVRDVSLTGLYGRYLYADLCKKELRSTLLGLPDAGDDRSEGLSTSGILASFGEDADCRIYVVTLSGPVYRLTEPSSGIAPGCPAQPSSPAAQPSSPAALSLDLKAGKQRLRNRLKLWAAASGDATLVANGGKIKDKRRELAANRWIRFKVELKPAMRDLLGHRLETQGTAAVTVRAIATDGSGVTATDKVKIKLKP